MSTENSTKVQRVQIVCCVGIVKKLFFFKIKEIANASKLMHGLKSSNTKKTTKKLIVLHLTKAPHDHAGARLVKKLMHCSVSLILCQ